MRRRMHFELSRRYPDIDVIAACSSRQEMHLVKTIGTLYPGIAVQFRMLIPWYYRILNPIAFRRKYTLKRRVIRNHNRDFFAGLDASYHLRTSVWTCAGNMIKGSGHDPHPSWCRRPGVR